MKRLLKNIIIYKSLPKGFLRRNLLGAFLLISISIFPQEEKVKQSFRFSGQLSTWGQFAPDIDQSLWFGGRYIPQINYEIHIPSKHKIDFELSANVFGDMGIILFTDIDVDGKIKPYRAWIRYSTQQTEVRFGLQKINFGSAQMFRPLMWFDALDPRDPLQLTDGVWGGLFRYYFQNNANIWLWTLYGNDEVKGWELTPASQSFPELGGRVQLPIPQGEIALSYHFRKADYIDIGNILYLNTGDYGGYHGNYYDNYYSSMHYELLDYDKIPENRLGFDIRLDRVIGMWLEGSWTHLTKNIGEITNQQMFTLGGDYTFGIGSGLGITFEQMLYSYDEKAFAFKNPQTFSGLMLSYPVTLFDNVSTMLYFDWKNHNIYSFINWQHDFKRLSLYGMLYWNPKSIVLPGQMGSDRFFGKGIQIMLVWNH